MREEKFKGLLAIRRGEIMPTREGLREIMVNAGGHGVRGNLILVVSRYAEWKKQLEAYEKVLENIEDSEGCRARKSLPCEIASKALKNSKTYAVAFRKRGGA